MALLSLSVLSCKKDKYEAPKSKVVDMCGSWWVRVYDDADKDGVVTAADLILDYSDIISSGSPVPGIITSNTAANDADTVLINDPTHIWPFKLKAAVDYSHLAFKSGVGSLNIDPNAIGTGDSVTVIEGKILKSAATSLSGNKVDSIYLNLHFSEDPANNYIFTGLKRTGFPADDY